MTSHKMNSSQSISFPTSGFLTNEPRNRPSRVHPPLLLTIVSGLGQMPSLKRGVPANPWTRAKAKSETR